MSSPSSAQRGRKALVVAEQPGPQHRGGPEGTWGPERGALAVPVSELGSPFGGSFGTGHTELQPSCFGL